MSHSVLPDRAIIAVTGEDAEGLLNRLFTNSMLDMANGGARYAALLSPQGKLLFDFFVVKRPEAFWIDCLQTQAAELTKKLTMFKLRSKVKIETTELGVAASWGHALMEAPGPAFRDPRHDALGYRIVGPPGDLIGFGEDQAGYDAHRLSLGVPAGGVDFVYGDTFVHDANLDLLHGVDFDKGCYVGQEVVSRVHHRNSARKRVVKVHFYGDPPPIGVELAAGGISIGILTSRAGAEGLATARVDRLAEADASHVPVLAGETMVGITMPVKSAVMPPIYADDLY